MLIKAFICPLFCPFDPDYECPYEDDPVLFCEDCEVLN